MNPTTRISLFLFGSGAAALAYQSAWLRWFRLVFGSSTAASAAVLAIFMGGLGLGGWWLGRRADSHPQPLRLYARLELGITLLAAISPLLIAAARWLYTSLGGTATLGVPAGNGLRIVLTVLVLGPPTVLMGGTLPAALRAAQEPGDVRRRNVGWLYGTNTIGAVIGVLATTMWSFEVLGLGATLRLACLLNLLVAVLALREAKRSPSSAEPAQAMAVPAQSSQATTAAAPVLVAAFAVGFVFFLMELVWYRMLAPLLGGTSYTFGLILAVALAGIGFGGLLYGSSGSERRPTIADLGLTCVAEAFFLLLPLALGDRIAIATIAFRGLEATGFSGLMLSWMFIVGAVVFLPALVSGYQFPLLMGLLGSGRRDVGRHYGWAYAANTAGSITGSLAGGFGLLPILGAVAAWRVAGGLLLAVAVGCLLAGVRRASRRQGFAVAALAAVTAVLLAAPGPTAFWRHNPIGAGRMRVHYDNPNEMRAAVRDAQASLFWEADGRESSVAVTNDNTLTFVVNGKIDGNALSDAPTQVMSGLIAAVQHPEPRRMAVVGLGTGSTAGWLASLPEAEHVDVVELEPVIERFAAQCAAVNQNALENDKLHLHFGDGREFLLTAKESYDVIVSEPSNPYRAGVASLFTRDFYEAVDDRLEPGGLFLQWLQAYEVDAAVVRTTLATLVDVFPHVEIWSTTDYDLLLLASGEPIVHDLERTRRRVTREPVASAMEWVWGLEGVEGFYAAFVANSDFGHAVRLLQGGFLNTDDRPIVEFGFARSLGQTDLFSMDELREIVRLRGEHRPTDLEDELDWERIDELWHARNVGAFGAGLDGGATEAAQMRQNARLAYHSGFLETACERWELQYEAPFTPRDRLLMAECAADRGDDEAPMWAEYLRPRSPVEADLVTARWHWRREEPDEAVARLAEAFVLLRDHAWINGYVVRRGLGIALEVANAEPRFVPQLFEALEQPFAVFVQERERRNALVGLALARGTPGSFEARCEQAFEQLEPHVLWDENLLFQRFRCYEATDNPLRATAERELLRFLADAPEKIEAGLLPRLVIEGTAP